MLFLDYLHQIDSLSIEIYIKLKWLSTDKLLKIDPLERDLLGRLHNKLF